CGLSAVFNAVELVGGVAWLTELGYSSRSLKVILASWFVIMEASFYLTFSSYTDRLLAYWHVLPAMMNQSPSENSSKNKPFIH
ncbi:hypothetical protein ACQP3C_29300, partial [Escherichia coli]